MNKDAFLLCLMLAVLAGGVGYHHYASQRGQPTPAALAAARTALGEKGSAQPAAGGQVSPAQKKAAAGEAARQQQIAAAQAAHAQIEEALHGLRVSSILLGDPAIVIVSKKEYGVGDPLVLPDGKTLQVTGIGEDGVALRGSNGDVFHLDAPAGPELAASRKK